MPEDMPDRMPEDMPEHIAEDMPGRMPEGMPDRMPEDMPDKMREDMPDRMPEDLPVTKRIDVMVGITRSKVFFFFSFLPSSSSWVTGCHRAIRFHFGWLNRVVLSSSLPLSDTKAVLQCCQATRPLQDSKPPPQSVAARKVLVSSGGHLVCNGYQWF